LITNPVWNTWPAASLGQGDQVMQQSQTLSQGLQPVPCGLRCRVMGVTQPVSVANGRGMSWNALLEVSCSHCPHCSTCACRVGISLSNNVVYVHYC
jgi:hypothetical protein